MDLNWIEHHLLSCPVKSLTGMDCPGCGMQRSVLFLIRGDFLSSFYLYPALLPLLLTFLFLLLHLRFKFRTGHKILLGLYFFSAGTVVISYLFKLFFLQHHS